MFTIFCLYPICMLCMYVFDTSTAVGDFDVVLNISKCRGIFEANSHEYELHARYVCYKFCLWLPRASYFVAFFGSESQHRRRHQPDLMSNSQLMAVNSSESRHWIKNSSGSRNNRKKAPAYTHSICVQYWQRMKWAVPNCIQCSRPTRSCVSVCLCEHGCVSERKINNVCSDFVRCCVILLIFCVCCTRMLSICVTKKASPKPSFHRLWSCFVINLYTNIVCMLGIRAWTSLWAAEKETEAERKRERKWKIFLNALYTKCKTVYFLCVHKSSL